MSFGNLMQPIVVSAFRSPRKQCARLHPINVGLALADAGGLLCSASKWDDIRLAVEECGQSASAFNPDVPREVVRAKNITKSRPVVEEESAKHGFRCGP